ncbi:MAG TPA: host-nuclease inhibitor Gam family protein [Leptospiraceae bacterium]|nr:host-nuclease inhibitor Gam family protein [Leptospiraceae bacterium]HMW08354.1 host-nuclease inhibitor Gam family protein [Leptospiraceae bacterium]HMY34319.1 host-nuclease inhibitor Gam family protein [Leptospiraceae bacterium]HMZ67517.1 host-nuclease inhibitor Gam family protein [Leptospiraceae bacterium]HNC01071.1 host-nuclease inhibitor Gam family protein [Leptospiraceae bacterium]
MAKAKPQPTETIVIYEYEQSDLPKAIAEIARLTTEIKKAEDRTNESISILQTTLAEQIEPLKQEIKKISLSVKKFTDNNREKLFKGGEKTVKLETGDLSYRSAGKHVSQNSSVKLITSILEQNNLIEAKEKFVKKMDKVFIRTKLELNKDAILQNPETAKVVTGVDVEDGEESFYIKPYSTNTELEVA